jgi:peptidoglycan hydrolase CwlO-like protein
MKNYLIPLSLGGLVLIVILQAILFASTGMQANRLQKQIDEVSQKFDRLQRSLDSTQKIITKINSFIDEPLPSDSIKDNTPDSNDLLSPENLNKTLEL